MLRTASVFRPQSNAGTQLSKRSSKSSSSAHDMTWPIFCCKQEFTALDENLEKKIRNHYFGGKYRKRKKGRSKGLPFHHIKCNPGDKSLMQHLQDVFSYGTTPAHRWMNTSPIIKKLWQLNLCRVGGAKYMFCNTCQKEIITKLPQFPEIGPEPDPESAETQMMHHASYAF